MAKTIAIEFNKLLVQVVLSGPEVDIAAPAQAAAWKEGDAAAQTHDCKGNGADGSGQGEQREEGKELAEPGRQSLADLKRATELLERLMDAVSELEARRQRSMLEFQQAAVELAVHVAEVITFTSISRDEYAVEELVRRATERLGLGGPIRIYLNPDDLALLSRRLNSRPDWLKGELQVELISSAEVRRGDCLAECGDAIVAAELDLRLEEIRRELLDGLEHAQVERRRAAPSDRTFGRFPDRRQTA